MLYVIWSKFNQVNVYNKLQFSNFLALGMAFWKAPSCKECMVSSTE